QLQLDLFVAAEDQVALEMELTWLDTQLGAELPGQVPHPRQINAPSEPPGAPHAPTSSSSWIPATSCGIRWLPASSGLSRFQPGCVATVDPVIVTRFSATASMGRETQAPWPLRRAAGVLLPSPPSTGERGELSCLSPHCS